MFGTGEHGGFRAPVPFMRAVQGARAHHVRPPSVEVSTCSDWLGEASAALN